MRSFPDPAVPGNRATHRARAHWGPVVIYCVAIFVQSCFPSPAAVPSFYLSDKLFHAAAYMLLAALVYRALGIHAVGRRPLVRGLIAFGFAAGYGISDEFHQSFVPGRFCEAWDMAADAVGAAAGAAMSAAYIGASTPRDALPID